jgi:nucleoside-diphosphate-sugar epimerase
MKVLVAGASGVMGRQLLPRLAAGGHEVVGMTRSAGKVEAVRALGAVPVLADALDPEQVARAVAEAEPEAIVHELTALSGSLDMRNFDRDFALTNRLRIEATDHLLSAGRTVGVQRFLAQSFAGWPYARSGGPVKTEEDPLDPSPVPSTRQTVDAIRHLEEAVTGADWTVGIALRYGGFYGPGTSLAADGEHAEMIRRRKFPVVGGGAGVWSFVHIEDAAEATVAALERGQRGIYNVVDDEPAPVREWLPSVASALGAKPPRRVPRWAGRLLAGEAAAVMMTEVRGASNAKAKRELGWRPRHPSWRQGIVEAAAS